MLYCCLHDIVVQPERALICDSGHVIIEKVHDELLGIEFEDVDYCCFEGGFAYCPPQVPEGEWSFITEHAPSEEEILKSNIDAEFIWS